MCIFKTMTTLPVTIGLMLLLSAVNGETQITCDFSHNPDEKLRTEKMPTFQNNHR